MMKRASDELPTALLGATIAKPDTTTPESETPSIDTSASAYVTAQALGHKV